MFHAIMLEMTSHMHNRLIKHTSRVQLNAKARYFLMCTIGKLEYE